MLPDRYHVVSLEAASHAIQHELLVPVMSSLGFIRKEWMSLRKPQKAYRQLCRAWKRQANRRSYTLKMSSSLGLKADALEEIFTRAETPLAAGHIIAQCLTPCKVEWFTWYCVLLDCCSRSLDRYYHNDDILTITKDKEWDKYMPFNIFLDWDVLLAEAARIPGHDPDRCDLRPWIVDGAWVQSSELPVGEFEYLRVGETVDLIVEVNRDDMILLRRLVGRVPEQELMRCIRDSMPKYHLKSSVWTVDTYFSKECFELSAVIRRMGVTGEAVHLPTVPFAGSEAVAPDYSQTRDVFEQGEQ